MADMYTQRHKRMKTCGHALPKLLEGMEENKYGSVTEEYEMLHTKNIQLINFLYAMRSAWSSGTNCDARGMPNLKSSTHEVDLDVSDGAIVNKSSAHEVDLDVSDGAIVTHNSIEEKIERHDSCKRSNEGPVSKSIIVIESDDEDRQCQDASISVIPNYQPSVQYHQVILSEEVKIKSREEIQDKKFSEKDDKRNIGPLDVERSNADESDIGTLPNSDFVNQDDSFSTGNHREDDCETPESDGLEDLWKEMSLALGYSMNTASDSCATSITVQNGPEDCDHDYLLKDDIGLVCRICGVIKKSITTIFDYQWRKGSQIIRTSGSRKFKDADEIQFPGPKLSEDNLISSELSVHPRHLKQMKPHQIEGFNFLVKNLVSDNPPRGCILAHAPGSGKTFMLISFIQSFLANCPSARPLIILPKGILPTWKREFQRWQVEDIPLYDFYSVKADSRSQQLEVLKIWEENKSILFLGYKQFSTIVCDVRDNTGAACQERLLKVPSLLILDEGHTPRNEDTNILSTLAKVQTPRKVVLSGTLFQNHVKEVFNILNLVRRKFLKMDSSRAVMRRILSRVHISGYRRHLKADAEAAFFELVEETLQNDDFRRKVAVIQDLREMTQDILHYYKGDFLEELPGHTDFTVLLNMSSKQKDLVGELGNYEKFKRISVGSAIYLHPSLKDCADYTGDRGVKVKDDEIDDLVDSIDLDAGVKTKFLLNILSMADSAREKMLVFSQYILPLRFLERLIVRLKGWRLGKEIFVISGDTNTEQREWAMEQFNNSPDAKILFGSIKACGEGISLVGASRVVILDVHLNPSVSRQAIGRAFRPGQTKKVYTYRLVAADSPEEKDHDICFRKELISKMWFEWSEYCGHRDFELERVDVQDCEDLFLAHLPSVEDIKALYRR